MTVREMQEEITTLYKRIEKSNKSAKPYKVDLHVHSPGSKDYVKVKNSNTDEEECRIFLESFIESDLDVIAITDHNTSRGFYKVKKLINDDSELKFQLHKKLILPGVEITCYGKHFLIIFPEDYSENKFNAFLIQCGIDLEEQGNEDASADLLSPLSLCEKADEYGGIVVIAHCDADNGLLQSYFKKNNSEVEIRGKSIEKILHCPSVIGICYNLECNLERLLDLRKNLKVEHIALIRASDSHSSTKEYKASGVAMGNRASWFRMGELSFKAIKMALKDEVARIENEPPIKKDNPVVLGLCISGGFLIDKNKNDWIVIPFSEELNCIIGARGTGKSTMIDILKFIINPDNKELGEAIIGRFLKAVVFLKMMDKVFAIRINPQTINKLNITYYQMLGDSFKNISRGSRIKSALEDVTDGLPISKFLTLSDIQSYRQKDILELAKMKFGPTIVIQSLSALQYKKYYSELHQKIDSVRNNILVHSKELINDRKKDVNADLTSDYLIQQYNNYVDLHMKINECIENTVKTLNTILKNELNISYKFGLPKELYEDIIDEWIQEDRYKFNTTYEVQLQYKRILRNIFKDIEDDYKIIFHLFTYEADAIAEKYKIPYELALRLCKFCFRKITPDQLVIVPQLVIDYELNVSHGISNKTKYVKRDNLSYGQRAVGMLLLILKGATNLGENRPLLIDQPEDDLDNTYIYHTLVKEFKKIKKRRQLIMVTHNPNIPMSGDSDNILALVSNGENGWIEISGNIDNEKVSQKTMQILEGDVDAFKKRAEKYGFRLIKIND